MHTTLGIYSEATRQRYCRDLEIHFFQLPKFKKGPIRQLNPMERWLAYFSNTLNKQELEELIMTDTDLQQVSETTGLFFQNAAERRAYIDHQISVMDYEYDKQAYIAEGEEKGRAEGEKKGRAEGEKKGRVEASIAIAKNMRDLGVALDTIAKGTGLSIEEILNL